jgi:hypothetical protein
MLVSLLGGCSAVRNVVNNENVRDFIMGNVDGEIGKTYSTRWFDFKIHSVERISEYAGYTPADGHILLDVFIEESNTFGEPIPMGTFDFYLTTDNASYELYPMDPFNDDPSMMPAEFSLEDGENVEYHMIFEFPDDSSGVMLKYTEIDEDDNVSATFTIEIPE